MRNTIHSLIVTALLCTSLLTLNSTAEPLSSTNALTREVLDLYRQELINDLQKLDIEYSIEKSYEELKDASSFFLSLGSSIVKVPAVGVVYGYINEKLLKDDVATEYEAAINRQIDQYIAQMKSYFDTIGPKIFYSYSHERFVDQFIKEVDSVSGDNLTADARANLRGFVDYLMDKRLQILKNRQTVLRGEINTKISHEQHQRDLRSIWEAISVLQAQLDKMSAIERQEMAQEIVRGEIESKQKEAGSEEQFDLEDAYHVAGISYAAGVLLRDKDIAKVGYIGMNLARAGRHLTDPKAGTLSSIHMVLSAAAAIQAMQQESIDSKRFKVIVSEFHEVKKMISDLHREILIQFDDLASRLSVIHQETSTLIGRLRRDLAITNYNVARVEHNVRQLRANIYVQHQEMKDWLKSMTTVDEAYRDSDCFTATGFVRKGLSNKELERNCLRPLVLRAVRFSRGDEQLLFAQHLSGPGARSLSGLYANRYPQFADYLNRHNDYSVQWSGQQYRYLDPNKTILVRPDMWIYYTTRILEVYREYSDRANLWSTDRLEQIAYFGGNLQKFKVQLFVDSFNRVKTGLIAEMTSSLDRQYQELLGQIKADNTRVVDGKTVSNGDWLWDFGIHQNKGTNLPLMTRFTSNSPDHINRYRLKFMRPGHKIGDCSTTDLPKDQLKQWGVLESKYKINKFKTDQSIGYKQVDNAFIFGRSKDLWDKAAYERHMIHNKGRGHYTFEFDKSKKGSQRLNNAIPYQYLWADKLGLGQIVACYSHMHMPVFKRFVDLGTRPNGDRAFNWLNHDFDYTIYVELNFFFRVLHRESAVTLNTKFYPITRYAFSQRRQMNDIEVPGEAAKYGYSFLNYMNQVFTQGQIHREKNTAIKDIFLLSGEERKLTQHKLRPKHFRSSETKEGFELVDNFLNESLRRMRARAITRIVDGPKYQGQINGVSGDLEILKQLVILSVIDDVPRTGTSEFNDMNQLLDTVTQLSPYSVVKTYAEKGYTKAEQLVGESVHTLSDQLTRLADRLAKNRAENRETFTKDRVNELLKLIRRVIVSSQTYSST